MLCEMDGVNAEIRSIHNVHAQMQRSLIQLRIPVALASETLLVQAESPFVLSVRRLRGNERVFWEND